MTLQVKICGLSDKAATEAALQGGASFLGFMFYAKSSRFVTPAVARPLVMIEGERKVEKVGLFVDAGDDEFRQVLQEVPLTMIQLHGHEEAARVNEVRRLTGLPIIKAVPVAEADDVKTASLLEDVADFLLFDAKTQAGASGGLGQSFDWSLLKDLSLKKPWFLAGGLTEANIAEAVRQTGAKLVDLSSGVEENRVKSPEKIRSFMQVCCGL